MSDDQDGCEWVSVSSCTSLYPGSPGSTAVKRLCVCVCVCACVRARVCVYLNYGEPSRAVVEVPVCCGRVIEVSSGQQSVRTVSSQGLLNCAPVTGEDVERVSTGTKFALREWLGATAD